MTGRRLADRYELLERRGSGGMAEVWEAIDHNLGRRVAVKMLHNHLAADPNVLDRFRSEAQAAARLTHPGIVGIYDTVSTESTDAIIMELVGGRDLRTILDERPTLAIVDAVEVGIQLSAALSHAHQNGIIHRDLKPANILVRPDRRVKLSDFGIAKALDQTSHTESGSLVGTVKYLAPEQIEGHPVDGRTDLYGLTTVLYEMLCGQVPFPATDLIGAMKRIRKNPPSARKHRPDVSPALDAFLQKGLARDPANRHPDAATWSAQLTEAMRGDQPNVERHPPHRKPEHVDATVVESPKSIPMRPAPVVKPEPAVPSAGPGPGSARPAKARPVTPRRGPAPVAEAPTPPPLAKHVKPKRRLGAWLGPLIALALMLAAVVTVWSLLRPAGTEITDRFGDDDTAQANDTAQADDTAESPDDAADDSDSQVDTVDDDNVADDGASDDAIEDPAQDDDATTTSSTTSTTTTLPPFADGRRAVSFDPSGDGEEHAEAVSRPLDGDPTTFWFTEKYKTRTFGQLKPGVGLIVEFETPQPLDELRLLTNRTDWAVEIYEADEPSTALDGWNLIGEFDTLDPEETLDLPDTSVSALLVWVTDLGLASEQTVEEYDAQVASGEIEQQLQIAELELIG